MDMNVVVLCGKLAAPPELRDYESGTRSVRSLITVRSDSPRRRVDVVPVTLWDPKPDHQILNALAGQAVYATASIQRRFWTSEKGRESRLEVVAHHLDLQGGKDRLARSESAGGKVD